MVDRSMFCQFAVGRQINTSPHHYVRNKALTGNAQIENDRLCEETV